MKLIFSLLFLSIITSCAQGLGSDENGNFKVLDLGDLLDLASLSEAVLFPKCLRCHSWIAKEDEILKRLTPGNPEGSAIYRLVANDSMPLGGPSLTDIEKEAIYNYILNLKEEDSSTPEPVPVPPSIEEKFLVLKNDIFVPKCSMCHGWVNSLEGVIDHLEPGDPENSPLFIFTNNGAMPIGGEELSIEELRLIEDFIMSL